MENELIAVLKENELIAVLKENELIAVLKEISLKLGKLLDRKEAPPAQVLTSHTAFRWIYDPATAGYALPPIDDIDPVRFEHLRGIDDAAAAVRGNTERFLAGYPANDVLLWGPRGTGKSSCIKALLNEYAPQGLKMIETSRDDLIHITALFAILRKQTERFIIYSDDLSFEPDEHSYRALKAALEGGIEARPANVLIYATSNRRHLMPERKSENVLSADADGQLHLNDSIDEKVSLSDRFGLRIGFPRFNADKYMDAVNNYAVLRGIDLPGGRLKEQAMRRALSHGGFSGRAAKQFMDDLEGRLKDARLKEEG
jgi:hypothetical protein